MKTQHVTLQYYHIKLLWCPNRQTSITKPMTKGDAAIHFIYTLFSILSRHSIQSQVRGYSISKHKFTYTYILNAMWRSVKANEWEVDLPNVNQHAFWEYKEAKYLKFFEKTTHHMRYWVNLCGKPSMVPPLLNANRVLGSRSSCCR